MEVLAPAGSAEALKAAILGGADAIYLGGKRFGARRFADNFDPEEMAGAVDLAHSRGVRVYVTVNTLIKERELEQALSYVAEVQAMGADAVIVQDRGLARLVVEELGMPVHASTQMGIHTSEGALWAERAGLERVILARELTLTEIAAIREGTSVGIEVFVHGALCYSFSGQCLFSSFAGGRSGNRGACAQPCRKRYSMAQEEGFLLSTADLFCPEAIPELLRLGVSAIKIEGRMRSPAYAYLASRTYSQAVRRAQEGQAQLVTERERELLAVAFSRGFSRGHLMEDRVMQRLHPDSRGMLLAEVDARDGAMAPIPPSLRAGDGITLYQGESKAGGFEVTAQHLGAGRLTSPFPLPDGHYRLYKTRDREFAAIEAQVASLQLRPRRAARLMRRLELPSVGRTAREPELSAMVSSLKSLDRVLPFLDRVYFEWAGRVEEARDRCEDQGVEFVPLLPRVTTLIPELEQGQIMVCSVDQAHRYRSRRLFGHYSLNVCNSRNIPVLHQCMASVELSRGELAQLLSHDPSRLEVLAYGRVELMVSKDPGLAEGVLRDGQGRSFPTYRDAMGYVHILNSADLLLLEFLDELSEMGVDSVALDLRRKPPQTAELVARAFRERDASKKSAIKRRSGAITTGHYLRGVL